MPLARINETHRHQFQRQSTKWIQCSSQSEYRVAVIGVSFVGEQLVQAFSSNYTTIAFDIGRQRVRELGQSVDKERVRCTSNPKHLGKANAFLIAVNTSLTEDKKIDAFAIKAAIRTVEKYAQPGSTVVIESSVAVGMTRELLVPLMYSRGWRCGMSPERVDPGNKQYTLQAIPKIISGLDAASLYAIDMLYRPVFDHLVKVLNPETAEMTKLYENGQRMMCIAHVNEMADACVQLSRSLSRDTYDLSRMNTPHITIDPWEVAR